VKDVAEGSPSGDADLDESREDNFSDLEIGDSDEEILNKIIPNEQDEEGQLQVVGCGPK
jgi:hypothetical protein